jgi:hypothetical protein
LQGPKFLLALNDQLPFVLAAPQGAAHEADGRIVFDYQEVPGRLTVAGLAGK